jgi:DMSO/TMAO reductase YedYZ heme-binding membrane subunit
MNEQVWWYLSRGSGIAAMVLLVATTIWGILLATRVLKPLDRPAWLLDLHRWLGGTAVVMTGLHLVGLYFDAFINFGLADLFVPGASSYRPVAVALGVISMYVLVAVQATSLMRRRLSKRIWHGVHLSSYLLVWGAMIHAGMSGTDVTSRLYQLLMVMMAAITVGAVVIRLLTPARSAAPTGGSTVVPPVSAVDGYWDAPSSKESSSAR